ncbi:MAG: hypothetical protein DMG73_07555, partial [Acidobacteria bacterium]
MNQQQRVSNTATHQTFNRVDRNGASLSLKFRYRNPPGGLAKRASPFATWFFGDDLLSERASDTEPSAEMGDFLRLSLNAVNLPHDPLSPLH